MTTSSQVELLPCPFCGGEAMPNNGLDVWWVECSSGGCDAEQVRYSQQAAIEAWNTRLATIRDTDEKPSGCPVCADLAALGHRCALHKGNRLASSTPAEPDEPCEHEWVIPRFGAEDERECRKCRITAEEVTRAEPDAKGGEA